MGRSPSTADYPAGHPLRHAEADGPWLPGSETVAPRAFWATFLGWALEAADAQTFGLVLPAITTYMALSGAEAGTLAAATVVFAGAAYTLAVIAAFFLPETFRTGLPDVDEAQLGHEESLAASAGVGSRS